MKYERIDSALFVKNRAKLVAMMQPKSLAVFHANDQYPIGADATMPFEQNRDLFYLTGADQEETILIICPQASKPELREVLFVRQTDEHIAVWEGHKLTKAEATEVSGIRTVRWTSDFDRVFFDLMGEVDTIYLNTNEHYRQAVETQTREDRFNIRVKQQFPAHRVAKTFPIMEHLRGVKEPEEIAVLQRACDITEKGFRRLLGFVRPGVWEYEVEAELLHEFVRNRSKGFAYTPIIAGGANANVLHYIENNRQLRDGEVLLIDAAAEYANYSSDMTRTLPVGGRFSARQAAVYDAVLRVKNEATKMLAPGVLWHEYHQEVGKVMTSELIGLGLLDKADVAQQHPDQPAYKKYFMHGTSHHLGLNTHDYGALKTPMREGMVFTVEPGIYIPEQGFGIRLEDNVVLRSGQEPFNLMRNIPVEREEVESLMNA